MRRMEEYPENPKILLILIQTKMGRKALCDSPVPGPGP